MHCSQVFRSSVPSELLPSSPGGRPSGAAQGECGSTRATEWGVGPGGTVSHRGCCPAEISPAGYIQDDTLPGPVRSQGRVARAHRAATRLGSAWGQRRAPHGLAVTPGQPTASYAGCSIKELWASQIVTGIDASEGEYLATLFLNRDGCAQREQARSSKGSRGKRSCGTFRSSRSRISRSRISQAASARPHRSGRISQGRIGQAASARVASVRPISAGQAGRTAAAAQLPPRPENYLISGFTAAS